MRARRHCALAVVLLFLIFRRTYPVKGEPTPVYPNKQQVDYFVNPCQAIDVPDNAVKQNCVSGAWVCQDTKVIFDDGEPKTLSLLPIAGTAPAADGVPAREVAPLAVLAEKIENVAEGTLIISLFVFVVVFGIQWRGLMKRGHTPSCRLSLACCNRAVSMTLVSLLRSAFVPQFSLLLFLSILSCIVPWTLTLKGGLIKGQDQSAVITFICDTSVVSGEAFFTFNRMCSGYGTTGTDNRGQTRTKTLFLFTSYRPMIALLLR